MTEHFFDLKGVDTGKVGNNKYVNYKLSDFIKDQNISPSAGVPFTSQRILAPVS